MQLKATQDEDVLLPPQTVLAEPGDNVNPHGVHNFVLVQDRDGHGIQGKLGHYFVMISIQFTLGHFVAQIRFIFRLESHADKRIFTYVQPFKPAPGKKRRQTSASGAIEQIHDEDIKMFRVVRCKRKDRRVGYVIPLTDIWRPIELIPAFGEECNSRWTSHSAVEEAKEFFVNCFSDKEVYQSVW